jgi:NAD(P)H dehydrogenase (quinone)
MAQVTVIYFSGFGHTKHHAQAVKEGVASVDGVKLNSIEIDKDGNISANDFTTLKNSDAIIFGSPTYMGGPAWQFKKFADESSKPWSHLEWKDKIAAGFTNSATINGDKFNTITYMFTLAMQHGMIWIGTGLKPSNKKEHTRNDINWLGGFSGALAQSPSNANADESPADGDLETAKIFGKRVAEYTKKTRG